MVTTTTEENIRLVRKHIESLNSKDLTAFLELHADDAVIHGASEEYEGLDGIERFARNQVETFPDVTVRGEDLFAADDRVAARVTLSGTHDGPFFGVESTGERVEITAIGIFRIEDGSVAEMWLESDQLGALAQLGALDIPDG